MSSDDPQTSGDEDEDPSDYRRGGYHPVKIGDRFSDGRYTVLSKLGWGHFSTVWLSWDKANSQAVALKIQKSAKRYAEAAKDEVKLLRQVAQSEASGWVSLLYDSFQHRGVNGLHHAMVFEVLGDNLLSLIKATKYKGLAMPVVRSVARAILLALDHLHARLRIIHTDLKPENVLCTLHPQQIQAMVDAARSQLEAPGAQGSLAAQLTAQCAIGEAGGAAPGSAPFAPGLAPGDAPLSKNQKKRLKKKAQQREKQDGDHEGCADPAGAAPEEAEAAEVAEAAEQTGGGAKAAPAAVPASDASTAPAATKAATKAGGASAPEWRQVTCDCCLFVPLPALDT